MATLKALQGWWAGVVPELQTLFQRMVELSAEKDVTLRLDTMKGFLKPMDEEEEFADIELDPIDLAAIAGGRRGEQGNCCQEETRQVDFRSAACRSN